MKYFGTLKKLLLLNLIIESLVHILVDIYNENTFKTNCKERINLVVIGDKQISIETNT